MRKGFGQSIRGKGKFGERESGGFGEYRIQAKGNSGERIFGDTGVRRIFSSTKSDTTDSAKWETRRDSGKEDSGKEQILEKGIGEKRHVGQRKFVVEKSAKLFLEQI